MSERLRAHQALAESSADRRAPGTRLPDRSPDVCIKSVSLDTVLARIHALPALSPVVVGVHWRRIGYLTRLFQHVQMARRATTDA